MLFVENYTWVGFLTKNYAAVRIIRFSKELKYSLTKFMLVVLTFLSLLIAVDAKNRK